MNIVINKLKQHQKGLKIILLIILISFLIAFFLFKKLDNQDLINDLNNLETILINTHINYLGIHILSISIILGSTILFIGPIVSILILIMELVTCFYNIITFTSCFKFLGLIYSLCYVIVTKGLYLIGLIIILKNLFVLSKQIRNYLFRNKEMNKSLLIKNLKHIIFSIIIIILYDIFIYFLGSSILSKLMVLMK